VSQSIRFACDVCGAEKGIANHWFLCIPMRHTFKLMKWDAGMAMGSYAKHICGERCAIKLASQWLNYKETP